MFWRRKKKFSDDLKAVAEVAGDQIAPGAGTLILVLGAAALVGATAYVVRQKKRNKKAASQ
jgi:LPXTG-motif cell wall-anchored protein